MRLRRIVALLTLTTLVLGACGGGDDDDGKSDAATPTTTATTDAPASGDGADAKCPMLQTEVELNLSIKLASIDAMDDGSGCVYKLADGGGSIRIGVSDDGQTERENFNEAVSDGEKVELLGRDAVWSASENTLDVLDNDGAGVQIGIDVTAGSGITDTKQAAIDLAGVVLAGR